MARRGWDPEKESWDEYKANRFAGQSGIGDQIVKKMLRASVTKLTKTNVSVNVVLALTVEIVAKASVSKLLL